MRGTLKRGHSVTVPMHGQSLFQFAQTYSAAPRAARCKNHRRARALPLKSSCFKLKHCLVVCEILEDLQQLADRNHCRFLR
jgi:hypothetical protein